MIRPAHDGALGPLSRLVVDGVTDVLVNGPGQVWVDGRDGLRRVTVAGLDSEARVRAFAQQLAAAGGRRLDEASPYVDARLPGGVRLHAVLPALSPSGTHLSLRIPARRPMTLDDLAARGSVAPAVAEAMCEVIGSGHGFVVSGSTGSGKTTVLAAMLSLVDPAQRLVVVEDSAELAIAHTHVVSLVARQPNVEGAGAVGLDVLVRQALRMRPDRLIVGECRGSEVRELLSALATGHSSASTVHAAGAAEVASRLCGLAEAAGMDATSASRQVMSGIEWLIHVSRSPAGRYVAGVWRLHDDGRVEPLALGKSPG